MTLNYVPNGTNVFDFVTDPSSVAQELTTAASQALGWPESRFADLFDFYETVYPPQTKSGFSTKRRPNTQSNIA